MHVSDKFEIHTIRHIPHRDLTDSAVLSPRNYPPLLRRNRTPLKASKHTGNSIPQSISKAYSESKTNDLIQRPRRQRLNCICLENSIHHALNKSRTSRPNALRIEGSIVLRGTRIMTSSFRARHGFGARLGDTGTNEIGVQEPRFQCIVNRSNKDPVSVEWLINGVDRVNCEPFVNWTLPNRIDARSEMERCLRYFNNRRHSSQYSRQQLPLSGWSSPREVSRREQSPRLSLSRLSCQGLQGGTTSTKDDLGLLRCQLKEAVDREDYCRAAGLRDAILSLEAKDPVIRMKKALTQAVEKEDYKIAAQLRDKLRKVDPDLLAESTKAPKKLRPISCNSDVVTRGIRIRVRR